MSVLTDKSSKSAIARRRVSLPRRGGGARRPWLARALFVAPVVIYLAALFGYPLVESVLMSVQHFDIAALVRGSGAFVGLDNYRHVLSSPITGQAVVHTAIFTVASVVLQVGLGLAIALYFNRRFRLNRFLRGLILVPWLLPMIATGTLFKLMFSDGGFINTALHDIGIINHPIPWLTNPTDALIALILVNVWAGVPFPAMAFYAGLQEIPRELYEAAQVDGASAWRRLRHITLPQLRPVTMIVVVYGIVYTLKVFDLVWVMTGGGPANGTQLLSTWAYTESFTNFDFGAGAAVSNVLLIFCLLIATGYVWFARRGDDV